MSPLTRLSFPTKNCLLDKFDFGCGWPSFTHPLHEENIDKKDDTITRSRQESCGQGSQEMKTGFGL
ncbi:peptide-methionine (R)-S-oxide reductase [Heliomicrobium modesticaldum]|uniref:peptide-methionine (R)-S-oxide reductase n=1 Tax=Heliomicrobium modesticaldum TaxID=35701 RepID=UPI0002E56C75|nr:peptide-methionine (R)-S-oxide reductase [Heliomicrobium modesticaldum]